MKQLVLPLVMLFATLPAAAQGGAETKALAEVAAAVAAKRVGSAVFLANRSVESVLADEFAPETAIDKLLRPLVRVEIDPRTRTAVARVLGVTTETKSGCWGTPAT